MSSSKILFLAANPGPTERLALDEEARDIEAKIRASEYRDVLLLRTRWAVRLDDLFQAFMEDRPVIVHFSSHGTGAQGIVLHDEVGGSHHVSTETLQRLFTALKDDIRVVVLNACCTAEQARAIASVIDCVIGTKQPIGDEAARKFAASFYRALGFGRSVKNAFDQGLVTIQDHGLRGPTVQPSRDFGGDNARDEGLPELFSRPGVDPNQVFIVRGVDPPDQLVQATALALNQAATRPQNCT